MKGNRMDIDVLGSYNTMKASLEQLKRNKGKIIFVSATLHYTGSPFQAHVSAAKVRYLVLAIAGQSSANGIC